MKKVALNITFDQKIKLELKIQSIKENSSVSEILQKLAIEYLKEKSTN